MVIWERESGAIERMDIPGRKSPVSFDYFRVSICN